MPSLSLSLFLFFVSFCLGAGGGGGGGGGGSEVERDWERDGEARDCKTDCVYVCGYGGACVRVCGSRGRRGGIE